MDITEKDLLEFLVEDDQIILRKYKPACIFCGSITNVQYFHRKVVCLECISEMFENTKAINE